MGLRNFAVHLRNWLRAFVQWLVEARLVIVGLLVPLLFLYFSYFLIHTQISLLVSGLSLEFIGILVGAKGLLDARAHFGHPSLASLAIDWLLRFPAWNRNIVISVQPATLTLAGGNARVSIRSTVNPDDPLDKQVQALAKNYGELSKELRETQSDLDKLRSLHEAAAKNEADALAATKLEVTKKAEAAIAGGVFESLVGLYWILWGIGLSTLSNILL